MITGADARCTVTAHCVDLAGIDPDIAAQRAAAPHTAADACAALSAHSRQAAFTVNGHGCKAAIRRSSHFQRSIITAAGEQIASIQAQRNGAAADQRDCRRICRSDTHTV